MPESGKGGLIMRHNKTVNPTLDEFFTSFYIPHARTRKRSWKIDERMSRQWISPAFGHRKLKEIRAWEVEQWLTGLKQNGLAASTCNRVLAILRTAYSYAEATGHIRYGSSPCARVSQFKTPPVPERFLSKEEGRMLMEELAQSDKVEAKIIRILLLTGARKSEILKSRWENLDLERGILTVPLSKSGKVRYIHLSAEVIAIFRSLATRESSPWVFPGRKLEKPLSDIYQFWNRIRQKFGLQNVRVHDLRHSFASYLVSEGHSLYEVQQLLGHSDPRMTMRYAHFAQGALKIAVCRVADILLQNETKDKDFNEMAAQIWERVRGMMYGFAAEQDQNRAG